MCEIDLVYIAIANGFTHLLYSGSILIGSSSVDVETYQRWFEEHLMATRLFDGGQLFRCSPTVPLTTGLM